LVGDQHHAERRIEHLGLHRLQVPPEHGSVISRKEILRPTPGALALDHRIDRDVAEPDLLHGFLPNFSVERSGRTHVLQGAVHLARTQDTAHAP